MLPTMGVREREAAPGAVSPGRLERSRETNERVQSRGHQARRSEKTVEQQVQSQDEVRGRGERTTEEEDDGWKGGQGRKSRPGGKREGESSTNELPPSDDDAGNSTHRHWHKNNQTGVAHLRPLRPSRP